MNKFQLTKYFLFVGTILLSISCSFDKLILSPDKIPANVKKATITANGDTTIINITGTNFQPTFTDGRGQAKQLDYTVESIAIQSSNKNNINAWFIKPANNVKTNKITLFFLHGNGGNIITHYPTVINLVKKGFQVFIFDYSGFGFSQGKATRKNILNDAISSLGYLQTREDVKNTKLIIYGQSLGGYLAPTVAIKSKGQINGLVVEGACSSIKDMAKYETKFGFLARILLKEKYSAFKSIKKYTKPLLVIHSSEDKTTPFVLGKKIYDNANQPKELYEIKKCHMCGPVYYADSIAKKILNL